MAEKGWKVFESHSGYRSIQRADCTGWRSNVLLMCLFSCPIFILCLWRASHQYNDVSVPTYLISCSAGKPWGLWLYQAVNPHICVKTLCFKWLVFNFCLKWFLGVEQFHQSFHTFILFILVFFPPLTVDSFSSLLYFLIRFPPSIITTY